MKKGNFKKGYILLLLAIVFAVSGCRWGIGGRLTPVSSDMSNSSVRDLGNTDSVSSFADQNTWESTSRESTNTIHLSQITVDINDEIKDVNYGVLGSALQANPTSWSPNHFRYGIGHLTGLGVWDPVNYTSVRDMVNYARDMGVTYFRFPGGFGAYLWEHGVGPIEKRPHIYWSGKHVGNKKVNFNKAVTFGLPEFLKFCSEVGANPVIGISEFPEKVSAQKAADMVEYLNGPCDGTCIKEIDSSNYDDICLNSTVYVSDSQNNVTSSDWAQVRVCDKYALGMSNIGEPWDAKWFEYGNESYAYYLNEPETYINNYLQYQSAMKSVDPDIKLGAVISGSYQIWSHHRRWNMSVIPGISSAADFYIIHKYVPRFSGCCDVRDTACQNANPGYVICTSSENLFTIALAGVNGQLQNEYKELNDLIHELTGSYIPIAVTEYNGSYNESDFDYFESFGNALVNAEHIKQLMLADNIAFATHHHFNNVNAGVIKGFAAPYKRRPVYYVFQFYHNHFGTKLLHADVNSGSYRYTQGDPYYHKNYRVGPAFGEHRYEQLGEDTLAGKDWVIANQPDGVDSEIDNKGVLTINFNNTKDVDYHHAGKETKLKTDTWYRLTGLIKTDNLSGTNGEGIYFSVQTGDMTNLIKNPDFESDTDNNNEADEWICLPKGYPGIELDRVISRSGNNSLRMDFDGAVPDISCYQTVALEPNTDYLIEGYIKASLNKVNLNEKVRGARIDFKDSRSWQCGYWRTSGEVFNTNGKWMHVYKNIITTSPDIITDNGINCATHDTDEISIKLIRQSGGAIKGSVWWDDISLSTKNTSKEKRSMQKGTTPWTYIDYDFKSKHKPDNPDGTVNAKVYVTRDSGGSHIGGRVQIKDLKLRELVPGNYGAVPYLSVNASKSDDGSKIYLLVVNKSMIDTITAKITLNSFIPVKMQAWTLNSNSVDASIETGVRNGGFEDDVDFNQWKINSTPGVKATIDGTVSYSGHKSLKIECAGTHNVNLFQIHTRDSIKVKPNTGYRLEGYIKTDDETTDSGLVLIARDGEGRKRGEGTARPVLTEKNGWTYVKTDFTTGSDTRHISIVIQRAKAGSEGDCTRGTTWIDHIVLTEVNFGVTHQNSTSVTNGFNFTFPERSLTALEISGLQ